MKKIAVISLLIISLPNVLFGCTCYLTESFNLQFYDQSENIAEIKVIEKLDNNYEDQLAQYQKDTIGWNEEYPPMPFLPPNDYAEFRIEVVEVFKGDLKKSITKLWAIEKSSSCYWEPKIGERYIFYFVKTKEENEIFHVEIAGCQKRIWPDAKNYNSEVEALRLFKEKKEGTFAIDQSILINSLEESYFSIKGKFKNEQRHGKWTLAEPISYSNSQTEPRKSVLILKYKNGILKSVKYFEPNDNHAGNNFSWYWKEYYDERKV
jgi:hypothetical protein